MEKEKQNILLSIVTVCYNSEKTIRDTLNSILKQDIESLEYIIIDGGSTDETLMIIDSYKELFLNKNIVFKLISEPDKGIYDAMNKGIRIASGDYIGFINSDDWYENEILKTLPFSNKEIDLIYGNMSFVDLNGDVIKSNVKKRNLKFSHYFETPFFFPSLFIKRLIIVEIGGFSLNYSIAADYDLIIKLLKRNKLNYIYVDKNITFFRNGGISTTDVKESLLQSHRVRCNNNINQLVSYLAYITKYSSYLLKLIK